MTGTAAAIAAEADTARAQRKARKELEIKHKYEAEQLHFAKNLLLLHYLNPDRLHQIHVYPHFQSRGSA